LSINKRHPVSDGLGGGELRVTSCEFQVGEKETGERDGFRIRSEMDASEGEKQRGHLAGAPAGAPLGGAETAPSWCDILCYLLIVIIPLTTLIAVYLASGIFLK
jgi:hypothetical protein